MLHICLQQQPLICVTCNISYHRLGNLHFEWWDAGMVICLGRGSDLHIAQLMPLPLTLLLQQIQIGFTLLVPAHPGSPGQSPGAVKRL